MTAYAGLLATSERANKRAVQSGTIKIDGCTYSFRFDANVPGFIFTDANGEHVVTLRGKKITVAKRDFREYMS